VHLTTTPFSGLSTIGGALGATVQYEADLAAATTAAPGHDAVVLVVSMEHTDEGEGFGGGGDRENLHLAGPHPKLWNVKPREWITALAAANPNLVVVLNTGSAIVGEPSLESAKGLVYSFYPGQAGGKALGMLLFGSDGVSPVNFSGKLPFTVANAESEYPEFGNNTPSVVYPYLHGYRKFDAEGVTPRYYYGGGLSYTTFEYANLSLPCSDGVSQGGLLIAEVDVTNTGAVAGTEIVQLYVGYPNTAAARRSPKELKAWARVDLAPGETQTVQLRVPARDLAYFNMTTNAWEIEAVEHAVLVGPSADPATLLPASFTVLAQ
jgi:beta-glucosidase